MDSADPSRTDVAAVGAAVFDDLARFRKRLNERVREVNAMTEKEVMGAAEDVHAIFGAASGQIAELRTLLGGADDQQAGVAADDLSSMIDGELRSVAAFATELNVEVTEQLRLAEAASKALSKITSAASEVGILANRTRMLALNARIEASRAAVTVAAFGVIAGEMKELSNGVAETNASIHDLARSMAALLPGIVRGANAMHERAQNFSEQLLQAMRTIGEKSAGRRVEIARAVQASDRTLSTIVASSQGALSYLQFQDAVAQGLLRLDAMVVESQMALCAIAGLKHRQSEIAPPIHVELGGEKTVSQDRAGEVLMF